MRRAFLAAGALLVFAGPAFADDVVIEKRTTTTTTKEVTTDAPASGSTVSTVILAPDPPPPPQAEAPPPPPGPSVVWTAGHWSWNPAGKAYLWVSGKYVEPPRAHAAWLPGSWVQRPGGWVWQEGRWD